MQSVMHYLAVWMCSNYQNPPSQLASEAISERLIFLLLHAYGHKTLAFKIKYLATALHLPQETVRHPESPTLLVCTAPALSGGDPLDSSINYTIIMDNAPGRSNSGDLRLTLVANPISWRTVVRHM